MTKIDQTIIDAFVGAAHGDIETVSSLLPRNPELAVAVASWGETAIQAAAQLGRVDIAEYLLSAGAPMDICTASMLGRRELVESFLQKDSDLVNATGAHGIPLLYFPVIMGDAPLAEYLYHCGAPVNTGNGSVPPLHGAVMFNQNLLVMWLLACGADLNLTDYNGQTALEVAQQSGNSEIIVILEARQPPPV